jgi:nucleoside-diphosphate-sugar epimerase
MKKILLTGGTGFVGSNILDEIIKHFEVTILIRNKKIKKKKNINYLYFNNPKNLSSSLKRKKFDIVIHCATHYKKQHSENDIKKMIDANIYIGNIILENYKKLKFKKFINFTSVWENFDGIKNNPLNLYAAFKISFSNILKFYKKKYNNVVFYNLYLSETFGQNDDRKKLLPTLKNNYKKNLTTSVISKNLNINIINIKDIITALNLILNRNIMGGNYALINKEYININNLFFKFNKINTKKLKFKWLSTKILKEKFVNYKKIHGWKPANSSIKDIIEYIEN